MASFIVTLVENDDEAFVNEPLIFDLPVLLKFDKSVDAFPPKLVNNSVARLALSSNAVAISCNVSNVDGAEPIKSFFTDVLIDAEYAFSCAVPLIIPDGNCSELENAVFPIKWCNEPDNEDNCGLVAILPSPFKSFNGVPSKPTFDAVIISSLPVEISWATSPNTFLNLNSKFTFPSLVISLGIGNWNWWDIGFKPLEELAVISKLSEPVTTYCASTLKSSENELLSI